MMDDMHALYTKVQEWEMEAHKLANLQKGTRGSNEGERHGYYMEEKAYKRVLEYIERMGKGGA